MPRGNYLFALCLGVFALGRSAVGLTIHSSKGSAMNDSLYFVVPVNPSHATWGIYTRRSGRGKFHLTTITLDRNRAIEEGRALMKQSAHPIDVAIQGATSAAGLADDFVA